MAEPDSSAAVECSVRRWLEKAVIGLNLCPFAKAVYVKQQVCIVVTDAAEEVELLARLEAELRHLRDTPPDVVDTTLLVHPHVLQDFAAYNQFLDTADALIASLALEGELQVASFHPQYRFAGTRPDDAENLTNRAPYPLLHLLRESSIDRAVEAFPDPDAIVARNIATVTSLGADGYARLLAGD